MKIIVYFSVNLNVTTIFFAVFNEEDFVQELFKRDKKAFDLLYERYSAAMFGVIVRMVKDEALAEETLQDAFMRIWEKIDLYDPAKSKLFTWIINLTRNLAIDKLRSKDVSNARKTDKLQDFVNSNEEGEQTNTDIIGIKELLSVLPEEQKFVVEFLYLRGYTQAELAAEYDIPLGTVKTRLHLAMKKLRQLISVG